MSSNMTPNTIECVQWQGFRSGQDRGLAGSFCITGNVWASLKYSWSYPLVDVQGEKTAKVVACDLSLFSLLLFQELL